MMVIIVLMGILATGTSCWGAPALVLVGRGNGLYEVLAQGLEDVRDIYFTVAYDPVSLGEPRVKQRSLIFGAMMIPDFSIPGLIRVTIRSSDPQGIKGSGTVAMLSFKKSTLDTGRVTSFTAALTSGAGGAIPIPRPRILADDKGIFQGDPFQWTQGGSYGAISGTMPLSAAAPPQQLPDASPGVPLSGLELRKVVALPIVQGDSVSPIVPVQSGVQGGMAPVTADGAIRGSGSIFSLFREYTGPRSTVQALTALFQQPAYPGFRQEPLIAISDGITKMYVYLTLQTPSEQSPNFALMGAKQVSLKRTGGEYVLGLIPDSGLFEASVTLLNQGRVTEYPLVVAPPLSPDGTPGGGMDETAFARFLQGYAEGRGDLNNDGRTDFRDLYMYTANYLVRNRAVTLSESAAPKDLVAVTPSVAVITVAPVPVALPKVVVAAVPVPVASPAPPVVSSAVSRAIGAVRAAPHLVSAAISSVRVAPSSVTAAVVGPPRAAPPTVAAVLHPARTVMPTAKSAVVVIKAKPDKKSKSVKISGAAKKAKKSKKAKKVKNIHKIGRKSE